MNTLEIRLLALGLTLLLACSPALALPDGPGQQDVASLCSAGGD